VEIISQNTEYNQTILFNAVKKYLKLKTDEKQFQAVAMLAEENLKFENQKLIVLLSNDAQHHLFDELKQEFLDFIRKEIQNNNLQIETSEHIDNSMKKALSPMEKFNLMAQKNPLLRELKNRLDLDPTFN
jgi:DNA polymerase-3 subunit gamma/tau